MSRRILVVEDQEDNRRILRDLLSSAGYELVACNYPSQVLQEADGRIKVTFWNATPAEAPLILRGRRTTGFAGIRTTLGG